MRPSCPCTRRHAALTSAHLGRPAGLGAGPLMLSSLCSEKVPVGGRPPPQREGYRMAASRQVTPPLGVPAPKRLPDAAASQIGGRRVGHPPPQCSRGSRRLGECPVPRGVPKGSHRAAGTPAGLLRLLRSERVAGACGGSAVSCRCGVRSSPGEMWRTELVSSSAPCHAVITRRARVIFLSSFYRRVSGGPGRSENHSSQSEATLGPERG